MSVRRRDATSGEMRLDAMMKRIDVYGRLAFGGQCVAAMALLAGPALFVTCAIVPFFVWDDNRAEALLFWLGGWAIAAGAIAGGVAFAVFCWRWSGDWITEWPGYATGIGIAAAANGVLAYLMTSSPVPIPLSFGLAMAAAFLVGCLVAGNLAGTRVLSETRLGGGRQAGEQKAESREQKA